MEQQKAKHEAFKQNKKSNMFLRLICSVKHTTVSAWGIIMRNKVQAILTLVGFFAAAFLVTSILLGAHSTMVAKGFEKSPLGADVLTLKLDDGAWLDADALCDEFKNSKTANNVIPMQRLENVEMYGNSKKSFSYPVIVTNSLFFDNAAVTVTKGKPFSASDVNSRRFTAVISEDAADELFGDSDPLGQDIKLNNQVYSVSGVFDGESRFNPGAIVIVPNKSARILLGSADVNTYVFTGVEDENSAKSAVDSFLNKMIEEKKKTSSNGGSFGYSIEYNGIQKSTAYMIGIVMYIIMLLLSGAGLLIFVMFPSSGGFITEYKPKKYNKLHRFILCELVCIIISVGGCALGILLGIPLGMLYCTVAAIQTVFDISLLWLVLTILGISLLFGILFGIVPGVKSIKICQKR